MKHSPGPWIVEQNMIRQPMLSKRRRIVCPPDHDGIQDAAFIVRACNAHEEMVKALVMARDQLAEVTDMNNPANWIDNSKATLEYVNEALRLAEGGKP